MTVAPVVVKAETDSKTASAGSKPNPIISGRLPSRPIATQSMATMTNPSWLRIAWRYFRVGSQRNRPTARLTSKDSAK